LNATDPIAVSLEAQAWNVVLAGLGELKWKDANPVIQKLVPQLDAAVAAADQPAKGNGLDHGEPDERVEDRAAA
jgi:hypothetical protein